MNFENLKEEYGNRYFAGLLVAVAVAAYLRLSSAFTTGIWVDEGRYGRIAFEVSEHLLQYSTIPEVYGQVTQFPPFFPYLLAFSTKIFGKTDFAISIVSPLLGVLGVAAIYYLGKEMKDRKIAVGAAALIALNPIHWFMSSNILLEAALTTMYTLSVLAMYIGFSDSEYYRYGLWALGPLVVLTVLTKQPGFILGLLIPVYFAWEKREELWDAVEKRSFRGSRLERIVTDRNYYIGIALGFLLYLPWMLREMSICGSPSCSISRAFEFAARNPESYNPHLHGPLYFIETLPFILTIPVAALLGFRVLQYIVFQMERDEDMLVKKAAIAGILNLAVFFLMVELLPLTALLSIGMFATGDEKLLWLWAGLGIGVMSIPGIKDPRYILYTVPALVLVAVTGLSSITEWMSDNLDYPYINSFNIMVLALIPILVFSFMQGSSTVAGKGYTHVETSAKWLGANTEGEIQVASTSPKQLMYLAYPATTYRIPENETAFRKLIEEEDIQFVQADVYEYTQSRFAGLEIPPYMIPTSIRSELQEMNQTQLQNLFKRPPDYLVPVKTFGNSAMPLYQNQEQPESIIYQVNRSAMQ